MAGLSATTGQAAAATVGGVEFDDTVNMVTEAGCDPAGGESCVEAIMEYAADDTLLRFPEGTYLLDTGPDTRIDLDGYTKLGLAGENSNVTFEFTSGTDGYKDINVTDVGRFVYENLDWDITADNCAPGFAVRARDHLHIENLEVEGRQDNDGGFTLQPGVANADGTGVIENFAATEGCEIGSVERNGVLVAAGRNNGTLRFVDCHLAQFSNNGIYAAASSGPIQVEGGTFRNSEPSQLRFSGEDSYVDGAVVELDISKMPSEYGEQIENARGIWWETKNTDPLHSGGEIRNTEVTMRNAGPPPLNRTSPNTSAGILIPSGGVTIKDTEVRMDITPRVAIYAQGPLQSDLPEPYRVVLDNVTVTGEASDWAAVQIEERPNSVVRNCEFDIGYRDGIILAECDGSTVEDTTINSKYGGGRPVVLWGTEAEIENVTTNNDDPLPDGANGDEIYGPSPVNGGGDTEPGSNTLRIEGPGEYTFYSFRASGNVSSEGDPNAEDTVDGATASGAVGGGSDTYSFDGELQNLYVDDGATVFLNDQQISPDNYESTVSIQGNGNYTSYDFTVTNGEITETQGLTGEDSATSSSASGATSGGTDTYSFTGTFGDLSKNGDATVVLNGQEVDPSQV